MKKVEKGDIIIMCVLCYCGMMNGGVQMKIKKRFRTTFGMITAMASAVSVAAVRSVTRAGIGYEADCPDSA